MEEGEEEAGRGWEEMPGPSRNMSAHPAQSQQAGYPPGSPPREPQPALALKAQGSPQGCPVNEGHIRP